MADMRMQGNQSGIQPGQGGGQTSMDQLRSPFNADDAVIMGKRGQITGDMTVGQYFESMGIKWEMPMMEAVPILRKQMANANPLNKARQMAGNQAQQSTMSQPQAQPQELGGSQDAMDSLMNRLRS